MNRGSFGDHPGREVPGFARKGGKAGADRWREGDRKDVGKRNQFQMRTYQSQLLIATDRGASHCCKKVAMADLIIVTDLVYAHLYG